MLYIQQSLGASEEIVCLGEFHWMHDFKAFFNIIFGIVMAVGVILAGVFAFYKMGKIPSHLAPMQAVAYLPLGFKGFSFLLFLMGVYSCARMLVEKASTEMAITNVRIIYKKGVMTRRVAEISVDRVEGVIVNQSLWGRMLDYGQVVVKGMGVGEVHLPSMRAPIAFRQAIQEAREHAVHQEKGGAVRGI